MGQTTKNIIKWFGFMRIINIGKKISLEFKEFFFIILTSDFVSELIQCFECRKHSK